VAKCWARIFENTPVVEKPQKKIVRKIIYIFLLWLYYTTSFDGILILLSEISM
jgi:hypothetical protein